MNANVLRYSAFTTDPAGGNPAGVERQPVITFSSGYVRRALPILPSHGGHHPWIVTQNYVKDRFAMRFGRVDEDLEFSGNATAVRA